MPNYYYVQSEPGLFTVGRETQAGEWHPDSDHETREAAAKRCNYLNGGTAFLTPAQEAAPEMLAALEGMKAQLVEFIIPHLNTLKGGVDLPTLLAWENMCGTVDTAIAKAKGHQPQPA
jgi:hypothetical protein